MNNYKIKIIAFISLLVVPTIVWFGLKFVCPKTYAGLNYDLSEKREKTEIESVSQLASSGDVLADYFADRAPFRSVLVSFYQSTNTSFESPYEKKIMPAIYEKLYGSVVTEIDSVGDDAYSNLFGGLPQSADDVNAGAGDSENDTNNTEAGSGEEQHKHNWVYAGGQDASVDEWGYSIYFCDICHEVIYSDWKNKLVDNTYLAPVVINNSTIIGRNDWLFLYGYGNINYYQANNIMSVEEMQAYMETLITLDELCQERGIQLAISIAPDKDQVYSEYMPTYTVEDKYKRTARLVDYIKENSDLAISFAQDELIYTGRLWDTYYKYDTHWNAMGAYIGTQALYRTLGMEVIDPSTLTIVKYERPPIGDLFDLAGIDASQYAPDTDFIVYYKEDINIISETGGEKALQNIYRTVSDNPNNKKLVMVGDSFRVGMIPYLMRDFTETAVFNREVISSADEDILNCDVLVLQANERNDARILWSANYIIELLSNQ